ncbi:hypothetical protein NAEGRDRAFT_79813 [Naegleria gruberi]|uniref:Uncharacterized protein n=1 Tax=Naegleria gruberi TaxID=5762 RepID=D2VFU3_NAEGR|nr:uncharacterized protein NAEGRDRAFT_79813 [Naegleria gruberi]EFC44140.1 hypothetical protein NAEGRDRAFT_79813 [Naegleria gruberi]|eukprot:XP_002676884.1 hypothetical protein NAEGRDRAFT_79813 [Naegleria gruberi strain NEG-M]
MSSSGYDLIAIPLETIIKLLFLDYFYDCKRKKAIKFKDYSSLFQVCNCFLGEIIAKSKEQILINDLTGRNSFLAQFNSIVDENPSLFPICKNVEVYSWFSKQSELSRNREGDVILEESNNGIGNEEDDVLEMLILTFNYHFKALFYFFQKVDSKFILNWTKESLSSLPKFILDELKVKHETRQSFKELLVYKEEELNNSTILDADFEFLNFLAMNTSDWKARTKLSNASNCHIYSSKEKYMATPRTTIYKFVYTVDKTIEEFSKAFLSYDFSGEKMVISSYWSYDPMNINHSSKKYSIVKGELVFNPNIPLISKRRSDD